MSDTFITDLRNDFISACTLHSLKIMYNYKTNNQTFVFSNIFKSYLFMCTSTGSIKNSRDFILKLLLNKLDHCTCISMGTQSEAKKLV